MQKPVFRWAGGKQSIVNKLVKLLPSDKFNGYIEPFVGAGSLFLNITAKRYILNDKNKHLINVYSLIQSNYRKVYKYLQELFQQHSRDTYYLIREEYNKRINHFDYRQAARFIYLVQTSFNGIYRVNKKGQYNVPFGKEKPFITSEEEFKLLSEHLMCSILLSDDFEQTESYIKANDFVYCDPPYVPMTSYSLNHYTHDRFTEDDHIRLYNYTERISRKGALVMISNSDSDLIRDLYKNWNIRDINVVRYVSCKKERKTDSQIIITNY